MPKPTTEVCRRCAGAGKVDQYNPRLKRIETTVCPTCGGAGVVTR